MSEVKFGTKSIQVPRPIEELVNRGAEALGKMTVDQRTELLEVPTQKVQIEGGLAKRLLRINQPEMEAKILEHAGLLAVSKELASDLLFSSWLSQPAEAKAGMATALAKIALLSGVSVKQLDALVVRLELIADVHAGGGLAQITAPLRARLFKLSSDFPKLLQQVRAELEILAYAALQKKIDTPEPKS